MSNDDIGARGLTFEQREGVAPLPRQLELGEISNELRAIVWHIFDVHIEAKSSSMGGASWIDDPWKSILREKWVFRDHRLEPYSSRYKDRMADLKKVVEYGDYGQFLGLLEWILRRQACPKKFRDHVTWALVKAKSAYRVIDGDTILAISDEAEAETMNKVLGELKAAGLTAPRTHLKRSAEHLTAGLWADAVRESVHAVESVARLLSPGETGLGPALHSLEKAARIHPALKAGFKSIYGYSSDEQGIRHPLVEDHAAQVDETDAIFMLGACASFVSYLIGKGRHAGILGARQ